MQRNISRVSNQHCVLLFTTVSLVFVIFGCEASKQQMAVTDNFTLLPAGQVVSENRANSSASLVFRASSWNKDANEPNEVTSTIRLDARPGPVIPHTHGDMPVKTWPVWHQLNILDDDGKPWITFNPMHKELSIIKDIDAGTGVPFNIVNRDYTELGMRFVKADVPNPWILHIPAGEDINKFVLLRDWLFSAIIWDEDGRTLIGRLHPHPPANRPAQARLNVRGRKDEVQFLIEADPNQTNPIAQIGDNGNKEQYFTVDAGGNIGIATTNPQTILTVQQHSKTDPIADAWTVYSSKQWKTNIKPIEGALDKVQQLRGVSFDWKANSKPDIGLVAEEVAEVIPEVVGFEENSHNANSVDYARLVAVLIEAMKEQQKKFDILEKKFDSLRASIAQRE